MPYPVAAVRNKNSGPTGPIPWYLSGSIQATAIYSSVLTDSQVAAISTAMVAL